LILIKIEKRKLRWQFCIPGSVWFGCLCFCQLGKCFVQQRTLSETTD